MTNIYIQTIEGNAIYNHINRNSSLKKEYVGMLPHSLETIKLQSQRAFKIKKSGNKHKTDDIINVKFNQSVKSAIELTKMYQSKLKEELTESQRDYYEQQLLAIKDDWQSLTLNELRHELYENGFTIDGVHYVFYKRSASKSRTGQALFINEKLFKPMKNWSHMRLKFNDDVDLPSLLAYESLVGSSIESTIEINPDNILIVSDVDSTFKEVCNVISKDAQGNLQSIEQLADVTNSLFDGQALLDVQYFDEQGMMLLRNHMFKSCAFNANIQQFLIDHCPLDNFDEWQLTDLFGNKMYAKDVHMITTPSSLKCLKFSDGDDKKMFDKWKKVVQKDGNLFGVVKHEKPSKIGHMTQQMSYQMINSLPLSEKEVYKLAETERQYIVELKNDKDKFVEYLIKNQNAMNSNEMIAALYNVNKDIFNVKMFKEYRSKTIHEHTNRIKSGKIRVHGDYFVLVGNPIEMLYHSIGQFNGEPITLNGSSVSCKAFEYNKALVGFRNPHTSPSNVLRAYNEQHDLIDTYINMTDNIVTVNSIGTPILDILSGADFDSDSLLLSDNKILLDAAQRCTSYKPCINAINGVKQSYTLTNQSIAKIDCTLSKSQKLIGRVVNSGQLCMSDYWHTKSNQSLQFVNIMTVLSTISIDLAKKSFGIDIEQQIKLIENQLDIDKKPLFFVHVSQAKDIHKKVKKYNCPMDYLQGAANTDNANHCKTIEFKELLINQSQRNVNLRQTKKLNKAVSDMSIRLNSLYDIKSISNDEKVLRGENIVEHYRNIGFKLTCKPDTIHALLIKSENNCFMRLLSMLYHTQHDTFISAFVKNS